MNESLPICEDRFAAKSHPMDDKTPRSTIGLCKKQPLGTPGAKLPAGAKKIGERADR